ncbi:MAG: methyltransferase domain-containing protein, partial [Desulfobacterales bacterium]|nr:methyltransferase domain-containing protein [Desulfobacterales bacterium]
MRRHGLLVLIFTTLALGDGRAADGPLQAPDDKRFTAEAARKMIETAQQRLAPVYAPLAEQIVNDFKLADKEGIGIDVGSGPGTLIFELCRRSRLYWINADINTFQAEAFFQRALTNECAAQMGWIFADVHHLPFRNNYADIVVSRGSFQF